jgi:hypothetical protein
MCSSKRSRENDRTPASGELCARGDENEDTPSAVATTIAVMAKYFDCLEAKPGIDPPALRSDFREIELRRPVAVDFRSSSVQLPFLRFALAFCFSSMAACAAASLAMGTRNGDALT